LGSKRRLVATIEWLRELPKAGPLPQLWHTFAIPMQDGSRIEVPPQLNGPAGSGQGGYSCGLVAGLVGNPAEVTLRSPVPLGRPLATERDDGTVLVRDGETLIAEGRRAESFVLDVPAPPSLEEAQAASERYESKQEAFSRCFVCGPAREDGQRVFAAKMDGRDLVASPWRPRHDWLASDGLVRPEFVWAVLDCPTYFASALGRPDLTALLGRLTAELIAPVRVGEPHVVMAWPLGTEGRKHLAGSAVATARGEVLARARGVHIEVSEVPPPAAPSASQ
jgi:hypothetical protein